MLFLLLPACSGDKDKKPFSPFSSGNEVLDSNKMVWADYALGGEYDSLINSARPYLEYAVSVSDTFAVCQSGIFIAQAFLFQEKMDSVKYYLDRYAPYLERCDDPGVGIVSANVRGVYALKSGLDYAKAFEAFSKGLMYAEQIGDVENSIVMLTNIVSIFYIRSDKSGISYAEQAVALAESAPMAPQYKMVAYMSKAQMCYLDGKYGEAFGFLDKASSLDDGSNDSYYAISGLLYADLYAATGNDTKADWYYRFTIGESDNLEPAYLSLVYLNYGNFKKSQGQYTEALDLYMKGLGISYSNGNHEFRRALIRSISDLYYDRGCKDEALRYYHQYVSYMDSVSLPYRDMEFSNLLMDNQRQKHEIQMQVKELAIEKANKRTLVVLLCLSFALAFAVTVFLYRRKQLSLYKSLVSRYQESLNTGNTVERVSGNDAEEGLRSIYERLEQMMQKERLFAQKDITLEKVASLLGTNRTYVSKCINSCSGKTFYAYIDMYRIREATSIISSDKEGRIPFKTISEDLGYKSPSIFYKAFSREVGVTPGRYRECLKHM